MSDFQKAMRPNQSVDEYEESVKSLEDQYSNEIDALDREDNPDIEPGASISHDEFSAEMNKLDGRANGLSEEFVENEDVFNADTGEIEYSAEGGYALDNEGNAAYDTYDSLDDFKSEYGDDVTITRRGSHDGDYFAVGDTDYDESSLAQREEYFADKTCEYEIESLPEDCKIVCGDVAEWSEAGHEGGGEQLQFAKLDENGDIKKNEDGTIDAYSVSDLEYDGHIKRCETPEKTSDSSLDDPPTDDKFENADDPREVKLPEKIEDENVS